MIYLIVISFLAASNAFEIQFPAIHRRDIVENAKEWLTPPVSRCDTNVSRVWMPELMGSIVYDPNFYYPHTQLGLIAYAWRLANTPESPYALWNTMRPIPLVETQLGDLVLDYEKGAHRFYPRLFMGWSDVRHRSFWTIEMGEEVFVHSVPLPSSYQITQYYHVRE